MQDLTLADFAAALRRLCSSNHWNQATLVERTGKHKAIISRVWNAHVAPDSDTLAAIVKALRPLSDGKAVAELLWLGRRAQVGRLRDVKGAAQFIRELEDDSRNTVEELRAASLSLKEATMRCQEALELAKIAITTATDFRHACHKGGVPIPSELEERYDHLLKRGGVSRKR